MVQYPHGDHHQYAWAPTGLTATAGNGQVELSWTRSAGNITGYKLRYAKTGAKTSAFWSP